MTLLILAYLGGVLTVLSPCILPVLPFVFARADRPFRKSGLPLLLGMALTFAGVATVAAIGGGWVVRANEYGRIAALVLLGLFGVALLFSGLASGSAARWFVSEIAFPTRLPAAPAWASRSFSASPLDCCGLPAPVLSLAWSSPPPQSMAQARILRSCCLPMRSERRLRWPWLCWQEGGSLPA